MIKFFKSIDYRARREVIQRLGHELFCKISEEDLTEFTDKVKQKLLHDQTPVNDNTWGGYEHG